MASLEQFGYKQELKRALTRPLVICYVLFEMDTAAKLMGAAWLAVGVIYFVVLSVGLKKPVTLDV
jgi:hypothetical protein